MQFVFYTDVAKMPSTSYVGIVVYTDQYSQVYVELDLV